MEEEGCFAALSFIETEQPFFTLQLFDGETPSGETAEVCCFAEGDLGVGGACAPTTTPTDSPTISDVPKDDQSAEKQTKLLKRGSSVAILLIVLMLLVLRERRMQYKLKLLRKRRLTTVANGVQTERL